MMISWYNVNTKHKQSRETLNETHSLTWFFEGCAASSPNSKLVVILVLALREKQEKGGDEMVCIELFVFVYVYLK